MERVGGPAVWGGVYCLGPSVSQGELCRAGVLSAALQSRLVSSEWSEFCYFKHATGSFEI